MRVLTEMEFAVIRALVEANVECDDLHCPTTETIAPRTAEIVRDHGVLLLPFERPWFGLREVIKALEGLGLIEQDCCTAGFSGSYGDSCPGSSPGAPMGLR